MTRRLGVLLAAALLAALTLAPSVTAPAQAATPITVSGVVTDQHGDPVSGARVRAEGWWGAGEFLVFGRTTADAEGHYSFSFDPKGAYGGDPLWAGNVRAMAAGHWSGVADLPAYRPGDSLTVDVEAIKIGTVAGTVVDGDGAPVAGAEVKLHNVTDEYVDCYDEGSYCDDSVWQDATLTTAADGSFSRWAHPRDLIGVVVRAPGFAPEIVYDAKVDDRLTIVLTPGSDSLPPATVTGTLRDSSGAAMPNHTVTLGSSVGGDTDTVTRPDGTFSYEFSPLAAGHWDLNYSLSAYQPSTFEQGRVAVPPSSSGYYEPGATYEVDLTLDAAGTVTGLVTDDAGTPLPGVSVWDEGATVPSVIATTDEDGRYEWVTYAGRFLLMFTVDGYYDTDSLFSGTVAPGEPADQPVHVLHADRVPGAMVNIEASAHGRHRAEVSGSVVDNGGLSPVLWSARCRGRGVPTRSRSWTLGSSLIVRHLDAGHRYHCQMRVANSLGEAPWSDYSSWFRTEPR